MKSIDQEVSADKATQAVRGLKADSKCSHALEKFADYIEQSGNLSARNFGQLMIFTFQDVKAGKFDGAQSINALEWSLQAGLMAQSALDIAEAISPDLRTAVERRPETMSQLRSIQSAAPPSVLGVLDTLFHPESD